VLDNLNEHFSVNTTFTSFFSTKGDESIKKLTGRRTLLGSAFVKN
jgi:hypothetical protein